MSTEATWKNNKTGETVSGRWLYTWHKDSFTIILESVDSVTGRQRHFVTSCDAPMWGCNETGVWEIVK